MSNQNYTVQTKIHRSIEDVFQAIVNEDSLCNYFAESSSGPLVEGARVVWHWSQFGDFPVLVKQVVDNKRIVLEIDSTRWVKTEGPGYQVVITMELESLGEDGTLLSISEAGWKMDEPGRKASYENCSGWTHMAMCLKSWIEHAIDLR
jgi:uncharacterized protein YndB with AHSA1/START domain